MITHLVFFKMQPDALGRSAEANARELVRLLKALPESIAVIQELSAGTDISNTPASYDVGLYTRFANADDLEAYRIHPEHQKVIEFVKATTSDRAVVDYSD